MTGKLHDYVKSWDRLNNFLNEFNVYVLVFTI